MIRTLDTIIPSNSRIIYRNFAGKAGQFNAKGDRNFCVILPDLLAAQMKRDGWNVKTLNHQEEGGPKEFFVQVTISYRGGTPKFTLIEWDGHRTELSEDELEILDRVDIEKVNLVIHPQAWAMKDRTGIRGFLQSITIYEKSPEKISKE